MIVRSSATPRRAAVVATLSGWRSRLRNRLSRQSIYVHFRSKARLLLELVDYVDESEGVPRLTNRIETAASGEEALDHFIDLVARVAPRIFRVVAALDAARSEDPIAATAWRDRADRRRQRCRTIVRRLAEEGRPAPELDVATATDLLWTLASVRVCEDLVVTRGGPVAATVRTYVEQFGVRCCRQDSTGIRIPREGSPKEGVMVTITNLFWNTGEARLRAGWRVVVFLIASFVIGVALLRLRALLATLLPVIYGSALEAMVYLPLIGAILLLASRVLDHRRIIDYGFHLSRGWWIDLGFGLALGTLLLLGILVLELAMGWVKVTGAFATAPGQPFAATILVGFIAVLSVAIGEEVTWRGYPIKNLAEGFNWRVIGPRWATGIAVLIPALLFGLAHATNPNATPLSTINIMIFAVLFAAGYVLTGELALPIGLHFAWDFIQGFVFGITGGVSQLGSVLVLAEDDPAGKLWTGLPYGAEGGPLGTGAFILGFLLTVAWVRFRRGSLRWIRRWHNRRCNRGQFEQVHLIDQLRHVVRQCSFTYA